MTIICDLCQHHRRSARPGKKCKVKAAPDEAGKCDKYLEIKIRWIDLKNI